MTELPPPPPGTTPGSVLVTDERVAPVQPSASALSAKSVNDSRRRQRRPAQSAKILATGLSTTAVIGLATAMAWTTARAAVARPTIQPPAAPPLPAASMPVEAEVIGSGAVLVGDVVPATTPPEHTQGGPDSLPPTQAAVGAPAPVADPATAVPVPEASAPVAAEPLPTTPRAAPVVVQIEIPTAVAAGAPVQVNGGGGSSNGSSQQSS